MNLLQSLQIILEVAYSPDFVKGMAMIGAGIAVFTGFGTGIGQGYAAGKGAEAIGRQPEAASTIRTNTIVLAAIAETTGIYGFVTALIMVFAVGLA
ncbi:MAG TPA: ATP synthase F0 subunit C [Bacilli bacterium]|nr:ATP synthase F0 subunit C [Bacilli bacterium]